MLLEGGGEVKGKEPFGLLALHACRNQVAAHLLFRIPEDLRGEQAGGLVCTGKAVIWVTAKGLVSPKVMVMVSRWFRL